MNEHTEKFPVVSFFSSWRNRPSSVHFLRPGISAVVLPKAYISMHESGEFPLELAPSPCPKMI